MVKNKQIMKKFILILLILAFGSFLALPKNYCRAEIPAQVRVAWSKIKVFADTNNNEDTVIICTLNYNDHLQTIGTEEILGSSGLKYYKVEITDNELYSFGYVLISQVIDSDVKSPNKKLYPNAEIVKDTYVFVLEQNNYVKTETQLPQGTKIKILSGYSKAKKYTQIQYETEDNEIVTAYIQTDSIKTSQIPKTLIGVIIIIATTISLVLIIFGITLKKKKSILK